MKDIEDIVELNIAEDIKKIIMKEISLIRAKEKLDPPDIIKLEKLAKTYATMMGDLRENIKSGLYGKLGNKSFAGFKQLDKQAISSKNGPKRPDED